MIIETETLRPPARTRQPHTLAWPVAKWVALGALALLVLLAITITLIPDRVWKNLIVGVVSRETGREASIDGEVRVHIFPDPGLRWRASAWPIPIGWRIRSNILSTSLPLPLNFTSPAKIWRMPST